MIKYFVAFCIAAVLAAPVPAFAHDGHPHNVMGTVTMVAPDHVMVKTTEGKDVTMKTTTATKVVQGKTAIKLADVKVGARVVIVPVSEKEALVAKEIQVGTAPATAAAAATTHAAGAAHK